MAKPKKNDDRRARLEAMRREAQRAERRRTMAVIGICAVVAVAIIAATGYYLLTQDEPVADASFTDGGTIGASGDSAGCDNIGLRAADGSADHAPAGTQIDYPHSPPAFGQHWAEQAPPGTTFYTVEDRPEVEQLVHNLEHGYTVLWYDETIADDPEALSQVEAIAQPFAGRQDPGGKFIAAPWTSDDGAFPEGKHVALTHWSADGEAAASEQGQGDWLYCAEPSADVVSDFMARFPPTDALEPNAA
jgi:hypothetical protein